MKIFIALVISLLATQAFADPPKGTIRATGTIYFELDMGDTGADGVNFAKFVPDAISLPQFPAVTSGNYAAPVRSISLEPADKVLVAVVGPESARKILSGNNPIIAVPVRLTLRNFGSQVECDARVYYATLVSAASQQYMVATSENMPYGC